MNIRSTLECLSFIFYFYFTLCSFIHSILIALKMPGSTLPSHRSKISYKKYSSRRRRHIFFHSLIFRCLCCWFFFLLGAVVHYFVLKRNFDEIFHLHHSFFFFCVLLMKNSVQFFFCCSSQQKSYDVTLYLFRVVSIGKATTRFFYFVYKYFW